MATADNEATSKPSAAELVGLLAVVGYFFGALLAPVFVETHEGVKAYARAVMYGTELAQGSLPVFLLPDSAQGAGAAFPVFYPPLFHTVAGGLYAALADPALAVNTATFLGVVLSAMFMHRLVLALGAPRMWALVAAVAYVTAPYRFVLVYHRGALAEALALAWYPLVALGLWQAIRTRQYPVLLVVAAALAVLSHVITTLYFALCCLALALACAPSLRGRGMLMLVLAGLHVGGLVAFHLVPVYAYLPLVHASDAEFLRATPALMNAHRVQPGQLFATMAGSWQGMSYDNPLDGMCFETGPAPWLLIALVVWLAGRKAGWTTLVSRCQGAWLVTTVALMTATLLFMVAPAMGLWLLPSPFDALQYPWRLLGQTAFLAALGLGLCGLFVPRGVGRVAAVAALLVLVLRVPEQHRQPSVATEWTLGGMTPAQAANHDGLFGFTDLGEYLPASFPPRRLYDETYRPSAMADSDPVSVAWTRTRYGEWKLDVEGVPRGGTTVSLPLLAYPFWRITVDGVEVTPKDRDGMLALAMEEGDHRASITRRRPVLMHLTAGVSLAALLLVVGLVLAQRRRPGPAPSVPATPGRSAS